MADAAKQVGGGEQRLGGDAAPVQAGPAELGALDEHHLGAELGGAQGGDVSGGSPAENHDARAHDREPLFAKLRASSVVTDLTVSASRMIRSCSIAWAPWKPSLGLARRGLPMYSQRIV